MKTTFLVQMVAGDHNEFYSVEGTNLPQPETIAEVATLEEARKIQKETEIIYLDEFNLEGEQIFLAPVVIRKIGSLEEMLD